MPADTDRGDPAGQMQSSLRQTLVCFPKPAGAAGPAAAEAPRAPPPHAAPAGAARAAPPRAPGPLLGGTPQEQLQALLGGLCERQLRGPGQPPRRAGHAAGGVAAHAAESGSQRGSQIGSDFSGQGHQLSTGYAGSSSSLTDSFTGPVEAGRACTEAAAPEGLSSLGASLHGLGHCTPCKFIRSLRGCRDGSMCRLCHEPHEELSRSGVRKAARAIALQRRAMIEKAEAAAAAAVPARPPEDYEEVSAAPWLRHNFSYAPRPGGALSTSSASTSVPGSGASSGHGSGEGPPLYCRVFSL